ncbi:hypothetical protein CRG98_024536 [Punica granatum]|uniref:Uncharacterized protein n=1 Tax=Punica granatum TaxID=22663 RepID=A0A2I0JGN3_PUNGR|nr:hypothetical protein CRG98_024536 [Punica granatum]
MRLVLYIFLLFLVWLLSCFVLSDAVAKKAFLPSIGGAMGSSTESMETASKCKYRKFHFCNFKYTEKNNTALEEDKRFVPTGPNPLHNSCMRITGHPSLRLI